MLSNKTVFNLGAWVYDTFTSQATWWEHCKKLAPANYDPEVILDVGCGPGISAFALEEVYPNATILGLDLADKMIARAQNTKRETGSDVDFLIGNAENLPLGTGAIDLVTGHSFLYLLPDRRTVLSEIERVLTPGGKVSFLEPRRNPGFGWIIPALYRGPRFFSTMIGWQVYSGLHHRFQDDDIERMFDEAGLKSIESEPTLNGLGWICRAEKPV